jgi:hypothetical protein
MLADRLGAKPALVAILGYQPLTLACYLIVGDLGGFYALGGTSCLARAAL